MATKMDSAEKAFEAATLEPAAKPATPAAPAVAEAAAPTPAKVEAPKTKTVKAKAKPVQKKAAKPATKAAPKKAAAKTIAPKIKVAPKPVAAATKGLKPINDTVKKFRSEARRVGKALGSTCKSRWAPTHNKKNQ